MSDIFLSYSRQDADFMARVRDHLLAHGWSVWTDSNLEPGTPAWERAIEQAISAARCLVVILSPDAKNSIWVGREIAMAEDMYRIRIFSILLHGDVRSAVPPRLVNHQHVDGTRDPNRALSELSAALQRHLNPAPPVSSSPAIPSDAVIVAKIGPADYRTITSAIQNSPEGVQIVVRPGLYRESLVLDKAVEILGDGPIMDIVLESIDGPCLWMQTDYAVMRGLTLRSRAGMVGKEAYAVKIPQGRLVLENCDITSDSWACIAVHNTGTDPIIRSCFLHNSEEGGVCVYDNAQGTIIDCDIFANALSGVEILTGANPTVQSCRIHENQAGVFVYENGQGTLIDCDIFANTHAGMVTLTGGNPTLSRCRINRNGYEAVRVYRNGGGTVEDCDLTGNKYSAWNIEEGCRVTRRGNTE